MNPDVSMSVPVVEMRGTQKSFGSVHALRGMDLVLHHNEVLGLVGDNAAGKTTLMKVLSGAYIPDAGEILIEGQPVHILTPEDSHRLGIEMVYQDLALANNMDVASNIFLGREAVLLRLGPIRVLDKGRMRCDARQLIDRLSIDLESVRLRVKQLSGGQRQAIAIGRATAFNAKVIIMDEPTAALSIAAIDHVIELIRKLKSQGISIIVISHRLEDIHRVADRVMIMRHGRKVGDLPIGQNIHEFREEVVAYIIGARNDFVETESQAWRPAL